MALSGKVYAERVRLLRDAGVETFSASAGYTLRDAASWSGGQKSAVTRAFRALEFDADTETGEEGLTAREIREFFNDGAGDNFEEWNDIDFFDFDEVDDLQDEETDQYSED